MRLTAASAVVVALALAGATATSSPAAANGGAPAVSVGPFVPAPSGTYLFDPVWVAAAHALVVSSQPANLLGVHSTRLVARPLGGSRWVPVDVPSDPGCAATSDTDAQPIGRARIVLLQHCWGNESRLPNRAVRPVVIGLRSHSASLYRRYFLPFTTSALAADPRGRFAIVNDGLGLEERLWTLAPRGRTRFGPHFLRAGRPVVSPDGTEVAVAGVPNRKGAPTGAGRADLPWNLYVVSARAGAKPRLLLRNLSWVARPAWAPNGRWLAVAMTTRKGVHGVWLVDAQARRATLVYRTTRATGTAWITGRRLAVTVGRLRLARSGSGGPSGIRFLNVAWTTR